MGFEKIGELPTEDGQGFPVYAARSSDYAPVDADVAKEREGDKPAGVVAREMALNAGIHSAENLRWMLDELAAERNRESFRTGQVKDALKKLLYALHARPMAGYELPTVEDAIAHANELLDDQLYGRDR